MQIFEIKNILPTAQNAWNILQSERGVKAGFSLVMRNVWCLRIVSVLRKGEETRVIIKWLGRAFDSLCPFDIAVVIASGRIVCGEWASTVSRLQLKPVGTRWHTARKVEVGKLANAVGSQYPSHYLGTWCIQHYYRACAHLGCQQSTELSPPTGRFKWTRPLRWKTKSGFCACAITFQLASSSQILVALCGTRARNASSCASFQVIIYA